MSLFADADAKIAELEARIEALETPTTPPPATWPPAAVAPPAFTPTRTVNVASKSAFDAALAALAPGDRVNVTAVVFTSQVNLHSQLTGPAEIRFMPDCVFQMSQSRDRNVAWLRARNLRVFGGRNMSNPNGHGILVHQSTDCGWWDFEVGFPGTAGKIGGSCVRAFGATGATTNLTLQGKVTNNAWDLSLDRHTDKGSGLHPIYVGTTEAHLTSNVKAAIEAVDCKGGSLQNGPSRGCQWWIKAQNLTYDPVAPNFQTGGNAFQPFGDVDDCTVWVEANNVAKVVEPTWLAAGASNIVVVHGRGTNVRKPPPYVNHPAVIYRDCL